MPVLSTPYHRKEWRLRDIRGEWVVLRWFDLVDGDKLWNGPFSISVLLNQWFSDSSCQSVLLDLCRELWGGPIYRPDHPRRNRDLLALLVEEFRCGRLVLMGPEMAVEGPSSAVPAATGARGTNMAAILAASRERQAAIKQRDDAARRAAKEKSWVAIRLQDEKGQPIPDERYRVVLPDGSVQEGKLNAKGEAYFYEINPGQCQISFPDVHRSEWKPA